MTNKKSPATRSFYICDNPSWLQQVYDDMVSENPPVSDLYALLAEKLKINLGKGFRTADPLRRVLEGKAITKYSAEVIGAKTKLKFRRINKPITGRPKKSCILKNMIEQGARIGVVPCDLLTNKTDGSWGMVPLGVDKLLREAGVPRVEMTYLCNRDVRRRLTTDLHLAIGASPTLDNQPGIEIIHEISHQRLGLLTVEDASLEDRRRLGMIFGSGEESLLQELSMDHSRIIGHGFSDPLMEHRKLFERVQTGELVGAISTLQAVASWMTLHWRPPGLLARLIQHTMKSDDSASETLALSLLANLEGLADRPELPLTLIHGEQLDHWLMEHLALEGEQTVGAMTSPFGIAVAGKYSSYTYEGLMELLEQLGDGLE